MGAGDGSGTGGNLTPGGTAGPRPELSPEELREAEAEAKVRLAEVAISVVLRVGVGIAIALVVAGTILVFANHGSVASSSFHDYITTRTVFPRTIAQVGHDLARGEGRGFIELGLGVLILTPILRVAVGMLTFAYEHDRRMALITAFVLAVLIGSFFAGGAS